MNKQTQGRPFTFFAMTYCKIIQQAINQVWLRRCAISHQKETLKYEWCLIAHFSPWNAKPTSSSAGKGQLLPHIITCMSRNTVTPYQQVAVACIRHLKGHCRRKTTRLETVVIISNKLFSPLNHESCWLTVVQFLNSRWSRCRENNHESFWFMKTRRAVCFLNVLSYLLSSLMFLYFCTDSLSWKDNHMLFYKTEAIMIAEHDHISYY